MLYVDSVIICRGKRGISVRINSVIGSGLYPGSKSEYLQARTPF